MCIIFYLPCRIKRTFHFHMNKYVNKKKHFDFPGTAHIFGLELMLLNNQIATPCGRGAAASVEGFSSGRPTYRQTHTPTTPGQRQIRHVTKIMLVLGSNDEKREARFFLYFVKIYPFLFSFIRMKRLQKCQNTHTKNLFVFSSRPCDVVKVLFVVNLPTFFQETALLCSLRQARKQEAQANRELLNLLASEATRQQSA